MFKLAFLSSLLLLALGSLGPGTINAATVLIDIPITVEIGRLSNHIKDDDAVAFLMAQVHAYDIIQIERMGGGQSGFKLPPNTLAPLPKMDSTNFNGTIEYDSAVIEFHHDCHWEAPQFSNVSGMNIVASAGRQWSGITFGERGVATGGSSIGPLFLLSFSTMEKDGTSAYFFSGGNSSFVDPRLEFPRPYVVDLTSLPTTFTAGGVGLGWAAESFYAPLSSVLVCDPRTKISGGRIRVTNDGILTVISSGKTPIGNIPQSAANLIFTNALQTAVTPYKNTLASFFPNAVNDVASTMFLANSSLSDSLPGLGVDPYRPLDLPLINQNMDTFMLSAAKAYLDGYRKNGTTAAVEYDLITVAATTPGQQLLLSTSNPLFIVTVVLVAMATPLLLVLCKSRLTQDRRPFDLNHVLEVLRVDREREALLLSAQIRE